MGRVFQLSLVLATLIPFAIVTLPRAVAPLAIAAALSLLGGTHVMATAYLYATPNAFYGVPHWQWTVVIGPLALMAAVFGALMSLPPWALGAFMLVYVHFAIWHFGRQNLGVVTFSARIGTKRSMTQAERWSIMAGVVAGMCAAYTTFAPAMMLHPAFFQVDATWA